MKKFILLISLTILMFGSCNNKLFSLATQGDNGIKLQDIITNISDTCDLNIIIEDNIAKEKLKEQIKYIKLKNLTLKEFLDFLLSKNGFFYTLKGNTLSIAYIKTKNFKIDYINTTITGSTNFSAKTQDDTGDSNTLETKFDVDFWRDFSVNINKILNAQVDTFYQNPAPIIDKTAGIVTITGTKKQLDRISKYIQELNNRIHKEVLIDVRIYSVKLSKSHQTGINWNTLNITLNGSAPLRSANLVGSTSIFSQGTFNIDGFLNFLATYGQVNSISNPKITTLNNQKAIITVGQTINYSYKTVTTDANGNAVQSDTIDSKFVGILLDITPQISDNNVILMGINPSISSLATTTTTNLNLPPDTYEKKLNTIIRVKDGDTIILGGLITDETKLTQNGVPILKEIPLIKYLFSYKEKISTREELIFVITPHIIRINKKLPVKKAFQLPSLGDL